jgi:signal peptidase II
VGLNGATLIPGFLSVRFTWNRGVSFGLFWQDSDVGSLLLFAGTALIVAVLSVWAYRTQRTRVAVAIGFIIGGALGNLVDRYFDHAVFDFLVLRLGEITLFICNLADVSITLGIVGLLFDSLWFERSPSPT